jgi:hypothetical protein
MSCSLHWPPVTSEANFDLTWYIYLAETQIINSKMGLVYFCEALKKVMSNSLYWPPVTSEAKFDLIRYTIFKGVLQFLFNKLFSKMHAQPRGCI